jgi:CRP-like cAMP-binding protein
MSTVSKPVNIQTGNWILAALPEDEFRHLAPHLQEVKLSLGQVIYEQGAPIIYAYFPVDSIISALHMMLDGSSIEVNLVGHEGVTGISALLGTGEAFNKWIAQVPGTAWRIDSQRLQDAFNHSGQLQRLLLLYTHALIKHMSQSVACNRLHQIEQRLCRWLLTIHDRVQRNDLRITHEFVARMLGVRRAGVTEALGTLQSAGMISLTRGQVTVLDRDGLEAAACECYHLIKEEFDHLYGVQR